MKNKHFIAALLILCWAFTSCASYVNTRQMNLTAKNDSGQILNLKYAGDSDTAFVAAAEKMIKNGFLNIQGEEYGYYDIRYEVVTTNYRPLSFYLYYVPAFWPLVLFGVPTAGSQFTLVAHFYIFDSSGNVVRHFSNTNTYTQSISLYRFGGGATKKGAQEFSKLFNEILRQAADESGYINEILMEAGPIAGNSDIAEVKANIDRYFKENPYAQVRR